MTAGILKKRNSKDGEANLTATFKLVDFVLLLDIQFRKIKGGYGKR